MNSLGITMYFDHIHSSLLAPPRPTLMSEAPTQLSVSFYFLSNQLGPDFAHGCQDSH